MVKLKNQMWAASKLAFLIKDGNLPENYKTRVDYRKNGDAVNWYQESEMVGEVYTFTGGLGDIHAGLIGKLKFGFLVAFRGTDGNDTTYGSIMDWLNNFLAFQIPFVPYGKGNVHMGFMNAVVSIYNPMLLKLQELIRSVNNNSHQPVYITGHSKGGAMAAIMASMLKSSLINQIIVYSFGAPRVGDVEFRSHYNFIHYRFESFLDIICHLSLSAEEMVLFKRMGILYETFAPLFYFPPYVSVGTGICIYKPKGFYGRYPYNTFNSREEKLNSFCAIEQMLRNGEFEYFIEAHGEDYE